MRRVLCLLVLSTSLAWMGSDPEAVEVDEPVVVIEEDNKGTMANNQAPNAEQNQQPDANMGNTNMGMLDNSTSPFRDCPVEARPIYVIDANDYTLFSFDPLERQFDMVGNVSQCPATTPGATPFSMAVDRDANAWVLYTNGELFIYNIPSGDCFSTVYNGDRNFFLYGMGFVLDSPASSTDVLYIAGSGDGPGGDAPSQVGQVNFAESSYEVIGGLDGDPELTGTAAGELWGFFPSTSPPKVAQIDRETGALGTTFPVTGIDGQPNAWAFAFWGGDFWLFYKSQDDPSTRVFQLDAQTGAVDQIIDDSGLYIVGAGVSTCAPLVVE